MTVRFCWRGTRLVCAWYQAGAFIFCIPNNYRRLWGFGVTGSAYIWATFFSQRKFWSLLWGFCGIGKEAQAQVRCHVFLTEKILRFTVRILWHRVVSHVFLTEKILQFFVRIWWHRVGTTMKPRFSHRENFASYCEDLVASGGYHDGATFFSQRKFSWLLWGFGGMGGWASATYFSQRKFCWLLWGFCGIRWVPRWSHVFLTEKILQFTVRILWHQVGTTIFSHRKFCDLLWGFDGIRWVPRWSHFFLTEKILRFLVRTLWHRVSHVFLTEKFLQFTMRILWHRVGTALEPYFSHRENFADFCKDLVASGGYHVGATFFSHETFRWLVWGFWWHGLMPGFSHREKFYWVLWEPAINMRHVFLTQKFTQVSVRNSRRKVEPGWCHNFLTWKIEGFVWGFCAHRAGTSWLGRDKKKYYSGHIVQFSGYIVRFSDPYHSILGSISFDSRVYIARFSYCFLSDPYWSIFMILFLGSWFGFLIWEDKLVVGRMKSPFFILSGPWFWIPEILGWVYIALYCNIKESGHCVFEHSKRSLY